MKWHFLCHWWTTCRTFLGRSFWKWIKKFVNSLNHTYTHTSWDGFLHFHQVVTLGLWDALDTPTGSPDPPPAGFILTPHWPTLKCPCQGHYLQEDFKSIYSNLTHQVGQETCGLQCGLPNAPSISYLLFCIHISTKHESPWHDMALCLPDWVLASKSWTIPWVLKLAQLMVSFALSKLLIESWGTHDLRTLESSNI